ncbi:hypothetical protein PVAG01_10266 [Phlyctema vagabunda]|uniref:Uncharacterized protein n=1 Tax=Phlyctema vagabunda TaxID=108571 RepID=A0ABR4P5F0_9HELO
MNWAALLSLSPYICCIAALEATPRNPDQAYGFDAGIQWLSLESSVLVRLATPNIPLYDWHEADASLVATDEPSAVLLNVSLSSDHTTLLLQGQPFLPIRDPSIPPLLEAYQIRANGPAVPRGREHGLLPLRLDYERQVNPRDDKSILYENYRPMILVDILGAGTQQVLKIMLKDSNSFPTQNPPKHSFKITRVWLEDRANAGASSVYKSRPCSIWSYRCADLRDAPWYVYISSQDFDEYGRSGSLRHLLMIPWNNLCASIGPTRLLGFALILVCIKIWPVLYGLVGFLRRLVTSRLDPDGDTQDWLADEEEEGDVILSKEDMAHREQLLKNSQFPQNLLPPREKSHESGDV